MGDSAYRTLGAVNWDGSPTRHELEADARFQELKAKYRMQDALKLARNFIQNCPESEQADTVLGVIEEALSQ